MITPVHCPGTAGSSLNEPSKTGTRTTGSVHIEGMSNPNVFTITAEITYRPFRVPPRCRKHRQVAETFTHTVSIPSVTSDDAPVVALIPNDRGYLGAPGGGEAELRAYAGKLWTVVTEDRDCTAPAVMAGSDSFPTDVTEDFWTESQREATAKFASGYEDFLVVDGSLWRRTEEPVYSVQSLGMGYNHGGTFLDIEIQGPSRSADRTFTLLDPDGAIAAALAIAERYGDDQSYDRIRRTPRATILDRTAFKVPTNAQRITAAEDETRAIVKNIRDLLAGEISHDTIREAKKLLDEAESLLWKHGLEVVEPA